MALVLADRVQETTNTTGTGTLTLAGAASGYQSFSVIGNANTTYYTIVSGADWEVGIGTYTLSGTTLSRDTVLSSSASGAKITVAAGATVFCTYPANRSVYEDAVGVITNGDPLSYSDTGILAAFTSTTAGYNQTVLQNKDSGTTSSTNITVANNNATATTNFAEFGINSSGFTGSGAFNQPSYSYVASATTDLAIGTYGSNAIHFVVNSGATDAATISNAGLFTANNFASSSVAITGGTVNNASIGATTQSTGRFTNVTTNAGTASLAPITLTAGTNLTSAIAGSFEFDTANTIQYFTGNTTNGRGITPTTNVFRLTANGAATATTISPFFGTTSSIPLVANGVYEIDIECYFLKNTAGTLTWTLTNSAVVTNMNANFEMSPITGVATAGAAPLTGFLIAQTAAAAAFGATGSLTTAVNHWIKFKIILENASSTSIRLNVTNSAGTITPLRNSYWKAIRLPATNVSTYAA